MSVLQVGQWACYYKYVGVRFITSYVRVAYVVNTYIHGYIAHTQPLFAKSRQLNLIDLNKLCTAAIMYRFHNNDLPDQFQNYFVLNSSIHEHLTRSHNRLHIPYARTVTLSCQLRIAGPKLWNGIDPTILVISQHIRKFKQVFKNHLLSFYN